MLILGLLATGSFAALAHGDPAPLADGARYEGERRAGLAHGRGLLTWPNGSRYEGRFRNGLMHGEGVLQEASGDRYEGQFLDGLRHGKGELRTAAGDLYSGEFRRGYLNGEGVHTDPNGDVYEGAFHNGLYSGQGRLSFADGDHYSGGFERGRMHGQGRYADADGDVYEGEFRGGEFSGRGRLLEDGELRYEGDFLAWRYHGEGVFHWPDGDRYEGAFRDGMFDGQGRIVFDKPAGGRREMAGRWKAGVFQREPDEAPAEASTPPVSIDYQRVFAAQQERLAAALAALPAPSAASEVYFVGFAGDGTQSVFLREMQLARRAIEAFLPAPVHSVLLASHPDTLDTLPLATAANLEQVLGAIGARLDPARDLLFLFMTSHGAPEHRIATEFGQLSLPGVDPEGLAAMLEASGIRWRIVVLSACYSGGFMPALASPDSIVLTAASADHVSFGCDDANEYTYFGEALFAHALPEATDLPGAAALAEARVREREAAEGFSHSEPQRHFGERILRRLGHRLKPPAAP